MHRAGLRTITLVCLAAGSASLGGPLGGLPASAQVIWDMKNIAVPPPKFDRSTVKPRGDVWPRLDPGAVLCKTEDDLQRLAASRRGEPGPRPNCTLIQTATPIGIVKRSGAGRTEVSLTDQNGTDGWTDAWLPEHASAIGGKGVQIK